MTPSPHTSSKQRVQHEGVRAPSSERWAGECALVQDLWESQGSEPRALAELGVGKTQHIHYGEGHRHTHPPPHCPFGLCPRQAWAPE